MSKTNRCLLLLNVGTPDSPKKEDVRKYLTQFLNDQRVIDLPWVFRKLLVNGIIIPFRLNTSIKIYEQLWKNHGRILDELTANLTKKLQNYFDGKLAVKYAMRYGNPSISDAIKEIKKEGYTELILFPLFPQNAMSTTETSIVATLEELKKEKCSIKTSVVPPFYKNTNFIEGVAKQAEKYPWENYDYVLFSYHGLPNRHIQKGHKKAGFKGVIQSGECFCNNEIKTSPFLGCYKAECYETSHLIAQYMKIPKERYKIAFQSRLSKNWLQPFSDQTIAEIAKSGKTKLLVFTPSFTIDCLETLNEIGEEYAEDFYKAGGKQLDLVPCLNDSNEMVELTISLLESKLIEL